MRASIKPILVKHNVVNAGLLDELNELFVTGFKAAKSFGARTTQLPDIEQQKIAEQFLTYTQEYVQTEGSIFAVQNLNDFFEKYGFYKKIVCNNK